jgi:hypothetical protein
MGEIMKRGVSILSSILAVVLCAVLAACGGTSSGSNNGNGGGGGNVTMQAGQWEFVVTPSNGDAPFYVEANLTDSGAGVFASDSNATLYQNKTVDVGPTTISAAFCGVALNGNISGSALTGSLVFVAGGAAPLGTFSATIAADGQSISAGSYTGGTCGFVTGSTGTLTGYIVAPLNGRFAGTLTSNEYGPDQVSVSIAQNATFGITASGTSVENANTTALTVSPGESGCGVGTVCSNVIGAIVIASGGVATNVNGSSTFQVAGHFNTTATQLAIQVQYQGSSAVELTTGTLTK